MDSPLHKNMSVCNRPYESLFTQNSQTLHMFSASSNEDQSSMLRSNGKSQQNHLDMIIKNNHQDDIVFMYEQLKHNYNALENQFSLYSKQALNKINQLEQQMDELLDQKQKQLKNLVLQNDNLRIEIKNRNIENEQYRQKCDLLQNKYQKLKKEFNLDSQDYELTKNIQAKRNCQRVLIYQQQIQNNNEMIQGLKDILSQQRIKIINQQSELYHKSNQNARLCIEIKQLTQDLNDQIEIKQKITKNNKKLKEQIQQIKCMLEQIEVDSKIENNKFCEKCQQLTIQNRELSRKLHQISLMQKCSNHANLPLKLTNFYDNESSNLRFKGSRIPIYEKYNKNNLQNQVYCKDIQNVNSKYKGAGKMAQVKQSIVHRCKRILHEI